MSGFIAKYFVNNLDTFRLLPRLSAFFKITLPKKIKIYLAHDYDNLCAIELLPKKYSLGMRICESHVPNNNPLGVSAFVGIHRV
jgi:hypothetical protein